MEGGMTATEQSGGLRLAGGWQDGNQLTSRRMRRGGGREGAGEIKRKK